MKCKTCEKDFEPDECSLPGFCSLECWAKAQPEPKGCEHCGGDDCECQYVIDQIDAASRAGRFDCI